MLLSAVEQKDVKSSQFNPQGIMLPKKSRVPIQSFPRNAKTIVRSKNFAMKFAANSLSYNRGGVIIGKSAGVAAQRNRLRRVIMELFQNNPNFSKKTAVGKDFIILVGTKASENNSDSLNKELETYGKLF
jgi:ribonuclease P protein component